MTRDQERLAFDIDERHRQTTIEGQIDASDSRDGDMLDMQIEHFAELVSAVEQDPERFKLRDARYVAQLRNALADYVATLAAARDARSVSLKTVLAALKVAKGSVSPNTVSNLLSGRTRSPQESTARALEEAKCPLISRAARRVANAAAVRKQLRETLGNA